MAHSANTRLAVDLDDIERQLMQAAQAPAPSKRDPLAELARIVGQDDPFRSILTADRRQPARPDIGVDDLFVGHDPRTAQPQPRQAAVQAEPRFDDYLQDEGRGESHYSDQGGYENAPVDDQHAYYGAADDFAGEDFQPLQARRSRKGIYTVGAILSVAALGVVGAVTLGTGGGAPDGPPPVVQANSAPIKVQPQNPGGLEIPNQNKQIYDRAGQDGQTKIVNREEQAVDVQQVARQAPRVVPMTPGAPQQAGLVPPATGPAPQVQGSVIAALGEPRRVRTVSVRPDGTIVPSETGATAQPSAPPVALPKPVTPTMPATPAKPAASAPATPAPVAEAPKPVAPRLAPTTPVQAAAPERPTQTASAAPAAPPQRVAALPAASATDATDAPTGGYVVQLGVSGSDEQARQTFSSLQKKFPDDLGRLSPIIRKAEVKGNTLYRVRVGPLSNDDASSLCTRLKSAGGECFVAKN